MEGWWELHLTCPEAFQAYHKATTQVERCEEDVAEEGRELQCRQQRCHPKCHRAGTVHSQPHWEEVQQEVFWLGNEVCQPVDGKCVNYNKSTVLWELPQNLFRKGKQTYKQTNKREWISQMQIKLWNHQRCTSMHLWTVYKNYRKCSLRMQSPPCQVMSVTCKTNLQQKLKSSLFFSPVVTIPKLIFKRRGFFLQISCLFSFSVTILAVSKNWRHFLWEQVCLIRVILLLAHHNCMFCPNWVEPSVRPNSR